jgi:hypothetical protein
MGVDNLDGGKMRQNSPGVCDEDHTGSGVRSGGEIAENKQEFCGPRPVSLAALGRVDRMNLLVTQQL